MGLIPVGSARDVARIAAAEAAGPACAVDELAHAIVRADDSLLAARSLVADRSEAHRWILAADRDLGAASALDGLAPELVAPLSSTRAAITGSIHAPDFCFDHAIDAARRSLAAAAVASGTSVDDARIGAAACTHPARDWAMVGEHAQAATATRAFVEHADESIDPVLLKEAKRAKFPDRAINDAHRAVARTARDELATTFDPIVHDLIEHTRQLRDVPLARMRRTPFELRVTDPPGPAITSLEYGLPIPESGQVARVDQVVREVRTKSGNGAQVDLPVGDYGVRFAMAQAKAAQAMHEVISQRLATELEDVGTVRSELLNAWTFQGEDVEAAMLEGVTSIAQATAVATQRRIAGMDEFELLQRLADSHVYDRLAKGPIGFIAPIARTGRRIEEPLTVTANGGVRLGPQLDDMYRETLAARELTESPAKTTRAGCPLALRGRSLTLEDGTVVTYERTLLTELAREYLDLVSRYLRAEPTAATGAAVS